MVNKSTEAATASATDTKTLMRDARLLVSDGLIVESMRVVVQEEQVWSKIPVYLISRIENADH